MFLQYHLAVSPWDLSVWVFPSDTNMTQICFAFLIRVLTTNSRDYTVGQADPICRAEPVYRKPIV